MKPMQDAQVSYFAYCLTTAYLKAIMEVYGKTIIGLGPKAGLSFDSLHIMNLENGLSRNKR